LLKLHLFANNLEKSTHCSSAHGEMFEELYEKAIKDKRKYHKK